MKWNRRRAYVWLAGLIVLGGCATQSQKTQVSETQTAGDRYPASVEAPTQQVNLCGQIYFPESNRNAMDDGDANYFLRVDCNTNGRIEANESGSVINIIQYRNNETGNNAEKAALTRTRRTVAKKADLGQAQIFKSMTPSGWVNASKNPRNPLPYEKSSYRASQLYMCADLLVSGDPCAGAAAKQANRYVAVNGQLNWYTTELDKARLPSRQNCVRQGRSDCFAEKSGGTK